MGIDHSILDGVRAATDGRVLRAVVVMYVACLTVASALAGFIFWRARASTAGSMLGDQLAYGEYLDWVTDQLGYPERALVTFGLPALVMLALTPLLMVVFAFVVSGCIGAIHQRLAPSSVAPSFWRACRCHAPAFIGLAFLELLVLLIVVVLLAVLKRASSGVAWDWAWLAAVGLVGGALVAVFDLARCWIGARGASLGPALVQGSRSFARNCLRVYAVLFLELAVGLAATMLISRVAGAIPRHHAAGLVASVLLAQLPVLLRLLARVVRLGVFVAMVTPRVHAGTAEAA